mgnify:CR=1 FL=1
MLQGKRLTFKRNKRQRISLPKDSEAYRRRFELLAIPAIAQRYQHHEPRVTAT